MPTGTEIERRFLLHQAPKALAFARRDAIRQGYVALEHGCSNRDLSQHGLPGAG